MTVHLTPSDQAFVQGAASLVPLLRANAAEAERERRIPDAVLAALADKGLFSASRPSVYGGEQRSLSVFARAAAEIGRGCGSTGWTVGIMAACQWMAGLLPKQAMDEIWAAGREPRFCCVVSLPSQARPDHGGLRVSGEWPYATGSLHADWALVGVPVFEDGAPTTPGLGLVPIDELEIKDTWHMAGMRASGSNTLVGRDLFIPRHRILNVAEVDAGRALPDVDGALYRTGFAAALILYVAGAFIGMAKGALELTLDQIRSGKRMTFTTVEHLRDSPVVQLQVAEAQAKVDTAELHLMRSAGVADDHARHHRLLPTHERARIRMDCGWALRHSREAIELLLDAQGAAAFAETNPVQRLWRDCEVGTRHGMILPALGQQILGADLCGGDSVVHLL
ncbi:acyl-CoA dehydrogenase family protein [Streptomyces sp. LX-29]|uniref:acyl-CoA dehydrogenase family protein n=1 Tax=Streptomyces sp. LX-29 TaxID=2900152 RepID=UPI00240D41EE|nr:acyl-CoA dehydrogenase family protein [Streptomyces sp. LX-29]WFB10529.1 acyl-CoA dehydrogenase family protein [Streptomyces sp. LX-29]